jgi:paraquat-inducible protein A
LNGKMMTAKELSLIACRSCHLLCSPPGVEESTQIACPRCGAPLHSRKPNSLARTWALVLAAFVLYVPANLFPITKVTSLGMTQLDTIMSGVIYFIQTGMWPIALVIFVASILVPLLKLLILTYLLITVQLGSTRRRAERTRLYRITEAVGRWSMLDVYVVSILVALVALGAFATIEAGVGAVFFASVVVTTMFAAMSFDPRLIWDERKKRDE